MELANFNGKEFNICHFQGRSLFAYSAIRMELLNKDISKPQGIGLITFFNNKNMAILAQQLDKNRISYINGFDSHDGKWDNRDKVGYAIRALSKCDDEIVILCDANDVLIYSFDNIIEKFLKSGKNILFNATTNNYPNILIDKVTNRDFLGRFRFFNAGCCIGFKKDLTKFYTECQDFLNTKPYNPWKSEQLILRKIFAEYLDNNNFTIGYDYNCDIFQTFANTQLRADGTRYRVL